MSTPEHIKRFVREKFGSKFQRRTTPRAANPFRADVEEEDEGRAREFKIQRSEADERGRDLRGGL